MVMVVAAAMPVPSTVAAVVVAFAPMRITTPVGTLHPPAVAMSHPMRLVIDVTRASTVPDATDPDVTAAAPVPVTRRPDVTRARCRHDFIARWRRRRTDADADTDLRGCRRCKTRGDTSHRKYGKQCKIACMHETPPS